MLFTCSSADEQFTRIGQFLKDSLKTLKLKYDSAAVLTKTQKTAHDIVKALNDGSIPAEFVKGTDLNHDNKKVKVMTMHSAKGLEFPIVAIARVDRGQIPFLFNIIDPGEKEAKINEERTLLSVGVTRAMSRLALTFNETKPSDFIQELDKSLWNSR